MLASSALVNLGEAADPATGERVLDLEQAKEVIDLYDAILREAAVHHVMLDFHGANKPTGMDRTWPNELTREGIYGFEHRGTAPWGPHDTTVPFARYLAGGADFTPTVFGDRRRQRAHPRGGDGPAGPCRRVRRRDG
jgi:hypothetical protein